MATLSSRVAARIRELRQEKGWSQERLAEVAGMSRDGLSRIERGDRPAPRLETIASIAAALGVALPDFLDFSDTPAVTRHDQERFRTVEDALMRADPWLGEALGRAIEMVVRAQNEVNPQPVRATGRQAAPPKKRR